MINPSILIAAALAVFAAPSLAQKCDGVKSGAICLADCKGDGIYVSSPSLVSSISLPVFQVEFDAANPYSPKASSSGVSVQLAIPDTLKSLKLSFTGAGSFIDVGLPGGPLVANLFTADYAPAAGDSVAGNVILNLVNTPMALKNNNAQGQADFGNFFKMATVTSGDFNIRLTGYADTQAVATNAAGRRRDANALGSG
ncbi:hypothetical protein HDU76_011892 [Blyttiomyces sp. JEL0837]|nr:hypothetical protein HDU76_011892 [Blyttiomyces sp. JEL0837]